MPIMRKRTGFLPRAPEGHCHLWVGHYDRTIEHVFDVERQPVEKIVTALRSSLGAAMPRSEP